MDKAHCKSAILFEGDKCIICCTSTSEKLTNVTAIGLATLRNSCEARERNDIIAYLDTLPFEVCVHSISRKAFTRARHKQIKIG